MAIIREAGHWEGLVHQRTRTADEILVWSRCTAVRDAAGAVVSIVQADRDMTWVLGALGPGGSAQRAAIEDVRRVQRLEGIGRLTGGIALELNNLLSAITGYLEFVRDAAGDSAVLADLDEVTSATYRAANLTRQLLVFSRSRVTQPQLVKPNDVVTEVIARLRRVVGERVRVETALDPAVPAVRIDPAQLEHALLSLALNGADAMPNGGTLTLTTSLADAFGGRGERRAVTIDVGDTGGGMDEPTRQRAPEPFFTTRPADDDAGLGLTAVSAVVTHAGGVLSIASTPGLGTRVSITLPVPDTPPGGVPNVRGIAQASVAPGRCRILLVEDDASVRRLACRLLEREGHVVVEARTGAEALALWREARAANVTIDVVITDVVMPDMGGRELVAQVRATEPRMPVVYVSGYLADAVAGLDLAGPTELLEKPFSAASLLGAVEAVRGLQDGQDNR